MSATYINLDPIAQSIRSFGSGLANNALKKAQLDRQLQNDIVAFNKAQVDMDYTKARNQREAEKHAAWSKVAGAMDLSQFTPLQQSLMGVNASAGSNVSADAIRAANGILNPGGVAKSSMPSMTFLRGMYQKPVIDPITGKQAVDINGVPKFEFDRDAMAADFTKITGQNLDYTEENIIKSFAGLLKDPQVAQAIAPQVQAQTQPTVAPVATNLPTQQASQSTIPQMSAEQIKQLYAEGKIDREQARIMALSNGIKWD